jgi:hypothetical protein
MGKLQICSAMLVSTVYVISDSESGATKYLKLVAVGGGA